MGYAERVLQPGEQITYRARLHWIIYAPAVMLIAAALAGALWGGSLQDRVERYAVLAIAGLVLLVGLFSAVQAWFRAANTEIIVTTRRIIYKTGFISRDTTEMNLSKVESVKVQQGVLGRIFDFGALIIRGVGAGIEPVANVATPLEFHRYVNAGEN
jgi:membrane protein YdbS with pleckstrin-like domain